MVNGEMFRAFWRQQWIGSLAGVLLTLAVGQGGLRGQAMTGQASTALASTALAITAQQARAGDSSPVTNSIAGQGESGVQSGNEGDETGRYQKALASAVRLAASRCMPSVVSMEVIGGVGGGEGEVERDAPSSGLIVDPSGFVLTSSLVTSRPNASLIVVLGDGERHAARVIARDQHRDLVLLKIDVSTPLPAASLTETNETTVGQTVIGVGRYGESHTPLVSRGILSAQGRLDGIALQCDARISPSFYGGPLVDLYGRVLGVLIPAVAEGGAESSTSWYDSGIAFAIPAEVIARKLARMKEGLEIQRGVIGIVSRSSDPYSDGTKIAAVRRRSPAEEAGLQPGDEITSVAGSPVQRQLQIRQALGPYDAGEQVSIGFRRGDQESEVEVTLAASIPPLEPQRIGIVVSERGSESDQEENVADGGQPEASEQPKTSGAADTQRGVIGLRVDEVVPGTVANAKFKVGDLIVAIDGENVQETNALKRLLISSSPETSLRFTVLRDGSSQDLDLLTETITDEALTDYPLGWSTSEPKAWQLKEWKLPEAGNVAAIAYPLSPESNQRLGLLLLLMNPGEGSPSDYLEGWLEAAKAAGVVVCAIAAEDQQRWQPKEVEVVARFAASLTKQYPINPEAVAVATGGALQGGDGDAADSMALAVALSQRQTFCGVSVSTKTQPPRLRLPENEGEGGFQLLLSAPVGSELPEWTSPLLRAGYPVVLGGEVDVDKILRWVRLLQTM
ncbi:MAG: PDZ domain-containing protein [Rubripirellula sp.]|nr:PDZ domain-containing protein [Rubripirellula sp.]